MNAKKTHKVHELKGMQLPTPQSVVSFKGLYIYNKRILVERYVVPIFLIFTIWNTRYKMVPHTAIMIEKAIVKSQ